MMKTTTKLAIASTFAGLMTPFLAFAQDVGPVFTLVNAFGQLVQVALPIGVGLALLFFIYALAKFILNSDDEEARKKARQQMIWGVVALFVIVSIWGLVGYIGRIFGVDQQNSSFEAPGINELGQ